LLVFGYWLFVIGCYEKHTEVRAAGSSYFVWVLKSTLKYLKEICVAYFTEMRNPTLQRRDEARILSFLQLAIPGKSP